MDNPEQDADRAAFEKWCYARGYSIYQDIQVGEAYDLVQAAKADSGARNPDLAKMVDDMRLAVETLKIYANPDLFVSGYYISGYMAAEETLTRLKPYEKLFEKEGER